MIHCENCKYFMEEGIYSLISTCSVHKRTEDSKSYLYGGKNVVGIVDPLIERMHGKCGRKGKLFQPKPWWKFW